MPPISINKLFTKYKYSMISQLLSLLLFIVTIVLVIIIYKQCKLIKIKRKYNVVVDYCKVFGYSFIGSQKDTLIFTKEVKNDEIQWLVKRYGYNNLNIPPKSKIYKFITIGDDVHTCATIGDCIHCYDKVFPTLKYFYALRLSKGNLEIYKPLRTYIEKSPNKIFHTHDLITGDRIKDTIELLDKEAIRALIEEVNIHYEYEQPYYGHNIPNITKIPNNEIWYKSKKGGIVNILQENLISNTYNNEKGVLMYKSEVLNIGIIKYNYSGDTFECIILPHSVTAIDDKAFLYCFNLAEIIIPNSVVSIGNLAFCGLRRLRAICIPRSVKIIGEHAFSGCINLEKICISEGVSIVKARAFYRCHSLSKVIVPNTVIEIGASSFEDCTSLTEVYCISKTPPNLIGNRTFDNNASQRYIYVPQDSVNMYKKANGWNIYAKYIRGYDNVENE